MRTTKTTLTLLVVEQTETDAPEESGVITTQGELVRARPIRNIRTTDSSERLGKQLGKLTNWLARRSA